MNSKSALKGWLEIVRQNKSVRSWKGPTVLAGTEGHTGRAGLQLKIPVVFRLPRSRLMGESPGKTARVEAEGCKTMVVYKLGSCCFG